MQTTKRKNKQEHEVALVILFVDSSKNAKGNNFKQNRKELFESCLQKEKKLPNHRLGTKYLASEACQVPSKEAYGKLTWNHS